MNRYDEVSSVTTGVNLETVNQKEPELRLIVSCFREVVERLEERGRELLVFEPKVSDNGVRFPTAVQPTEAQVENYTTDLRGLLGRLRAVDEDQLTPTVAFLKAFL